MNEKIEQLQNIIDSSERIVFFTGAGVSTDSGIPDFRSQDGLYHQEYKYPPETIISRTFFDANPEEFYRFYKNRMLFPDAKPNRVHTYMAELEQRGKDVSVVTQNIDGLHTEAGSTKVYEVHGSVLRNYCMRCHKFHGIDAVINADGIPRCECGGIIKPDVVLYEEPLDSTVIDGAVRAISRADTLIVLGTSLVVYPAAGFIRYYRGDRLVLINRDATPYDSMADLHILDTFDHVFPYLK
ncbi:MAG: NAD-dependent protein deacylase [Solobacterium sp.]|jgi:NAD-dependent deacetylase|nr:NAD-dependent protein deacylase [Solobacterium sp.]